MHLSLGGSLNAVICPIDGAVYRLPVICVMILSIIIPGRNKKCSNPHHNHTIHHQYAALPGSGR